jgi:hypothetical protein
MKIILLVFLTLLCSFTAASQGSIDVLCLDNDSIIIGRFQEDIDGMIVIVSIDSIQYIVPYDRFDWIVENYNPYKIPGWFNEAANKQITSFALILVGIGAAILAPPTIGVLAAGGCSVIAIGLQVSSWYQFKKIGKTMLIRDKIERGQIWSSE